MLAIFIIYWLQHKASHQMILPGLGVILQQPINTSKARTEVRIRPF